jgi:hypothetical protein
VPGVGAGRKCPAVAGSGAGVSPFVRFVVAGAAGVFLYIAWNVWGAFN